MPAAGHSRHSLPGEESHPGVVMWHECFRRILTAANELKEKRSKQPTPILTLPLRDCVAIGVMGNTRQNGCPGSSATRFLKFRRETPPERTTKHIPIFSHLRRSGGGWGICRSRVKLTIAWNGTIKISASTRMTTWIGYLRTDAYGQGLATDQRKQ